MKSTMMIVLILTTSAAFAASGIKGLNPDSSTLDAHGSLEGQSWVCEAQGVQNFGGPAGQIWQTVVAQGDSQFEATDRAQQECFDEGLEQCMVTNCHVAD